MEGKELAKVMFKGEISEWREVTIINAENKWIIIENKLEWTN